MSLRVPRVRTPGRSAMVTPVTLADTPLTQARLDALVARIEAERPRYVAALRALMDPDWQARVFFVVGRQEVRERDDDINARYIVEQADIRGVPDEKLTQALRDDLDALVGQRLDSGEADRFQERIERELPQYDVSRRMQRGSQVGRLKIVFEARKRELPQWLRWIAVARKRQQDDGPVFYSEE